MRLSLFRRLWSEDIAKAQCGRVSGFPGGSVRRWTFPPLLLARLAWKCWEHGCTFGSWSFAEVRMREQSLCADPLGRIKA